MKLMPMMQGIDRQSGVALLMSLIILVMLLLILLASLGTTMLEEQMASNLRQQNIAFQAAESALREAEAQILFPGRLVDWNGDGLGTDNPFHPLKFNNGPFQNEACVSGLCGGIGQSSHIRSLGEDETRTASTGIANVFREPQYIIEMITKNPYDIPDFGDSGRTFAVFRITARAWGEDPSSFVVLQSTFKLHALSFSF